VGRGRGDNAKHFFSLIIEGNVHRFEWSHRILAFEFSILETASKK
jgi:hypothetical protein